jgi:hypothetical protein
MNNHSNEVLLNIQKYVCSKKDALCLNLCFDDSGLCNECINKYEKHDITNKNDYENVKLKVVNVISNYLVEIEKIESKFDKIEFVFGIFRVLLCNPVFIIFHSKFCFTFINKIFEFLSDDLTSIRIDKYYHDNKNDVYVSYVYNYIQQIYNTFKNNISDYNTNYDSIVPIYINFIEEYYKNTHIKNNVSVTKPIKVITNKKYKFNDITIDVNIDIYNNISDNMIIL